MAEYNVGIAGFFATGKSKAGGQEAKTCAIEREVIKEFGAESIYRVDTTNWKKHPIKLLYRLINLVFKCDNIIILPAQKSVRVFVPILVILNRICKRRIFYAVVGGWLPTLFESHKRVAFYANELTAILVETKSMKMSLEKMGFTNIVIMPNFKELTPVAEDELRSQYELPLRFCTFSRVMKEKGIEDAIRAIEIVNHDIGITAFTLDIYGKIDPGYYERFHEVINNLPSYIRYAGMVEPDESVTVLKNYFALLFPTQYYTEGVPGTIIDAYMAGIPVVSALWGNYEDVFIPEYTGYGYRFMDMDDLVAVLKRIYMDPNAFLKLNKNSLLESKRYLSSNAYLILSNLLYKEE